MRVLYVVFVLSIAALVWAILAVTRHIRNHEARAGAAPGLKGRKGDDPLKPID
jgi:hypothetical protein